MGSDSYHWCDSSLSLSVWLPAPGRTPPSCGRWCRSPDWGTVGDCGPGGEWRDRPGPTPSLVLLSPVCYLLSDIWPRSSSLWQVLIFTEQLSSCLRAGLGRWLPPTHPLPLPPIVSRQPFKKILFLDMRQRHRDTERQRLVSILMFYYLSAYFSGLISVAGWDLMEAERSDNLNSCKPFSIQTLSPAR